MLLHHNKLAITVGGITFTSGNMLGEIKSKFVLDPKAISGWHDGINTKRDNTSRPVSMGDFPERAYKSSRLIQLSGTAVADSIRELQELRDEFASILSHGEYEYMRVTSYVESGDNSWGSQDPDNSFISERYISVGIEGTPTWVQQIDTAASWKLDLYAPDPRMYGPTRQIMITDSTYSGGLSYPLRSTITYNKPESVILPTISNEGNIDSWPAFRVTGDFMSGFELTNMRGSVIRYEGAVTMQSPVIIDMGAGTAEQDGMDRTSLISKRQWFSIPKGSTIQPAFLPIQDGTGWCDIIYRDTWI